VPRIYHPDGVYHLTAHGVDDRPIFLDDLDRHAFCLRLRRVALASRWELHAVCLMDTHYHLLTRPTLGLVSNAMRVLNGAHSRAFNSRHGRRGALFESRYADREIRNDEHLLAAIAYIEANPVSAGIAIDPADWPWSTYGDSPLRALLKGCLTP
jgi:putative transposase